MGKALEVGLTMASAGSRFLTSFLYKVSGSGDNSDGTLGCTFLSPIQALPP